MNTRRAAFHLALLLSVECVAIATVGALRSAPAPLLRRAVKGDALHPAWASGRWKMHWNTGYYSYDLRRDGTCRSWSPSSAVGSEPDYEGTWNVSGTGLCITEHARSGSRYTFQVDFAAEMRIRSGGCVGTLVSLERPPITD